MRDHIVVKPIYREASERIQVLHQELPTLGLVKAVGPGKRDKKGRLKPLDVKVGDTIKFGAGDYLKFPELWEGNEKYLVLQEADVAGIIEPEAIPSFEQFRAAGRKLDSLPIPTKDRKLA